MMVLSDRQRVELALPARLMWEAATVAVEDREDAEALSVRAELLAACLEPLAGLTSKESGKLARRIEREMLAVVRPYVDKTSAAKVAMSVYYFLEELLTRGILELYEGAPLANATAKITSLLADHFAQPALDASAQKQGLRMLASCQAAGLYA